MTHIAKRCNVLLFLLLAAAFVTAPMLAQNLAEVSKSSSGLSFHTNSFDSGFSLTIGGPDGDVTRREFAAGQAPSFDLGSGSYSNGTYTWELRAIAAPRGRDEAPASPTARTVQSGYFTVASGSIITDREEIVAPKAEAGPLTKAQVFVTDLIVQGSGCIGFDCTSTESFGFDTLRLKENNLRIKFDDTSGSGSFPNNDWQITANDSSNGGANRFSIDDITGGKTPFNILAGAPSNSLYVNASGNIGVGTANPVVEMQIVDGDSPTLRLEQDGSSGFTPQTWDLAGNETNFFVRDVTNGSKLPFRIKPGADDNRIFLNNDNNVGFGTDSPDARHHIIGQTLIEPTDTGAITEDALLLIKGTDGNAQLVITEASTSVAIRNLIELKNNGAARITFNDTRTNDNWSNAAVQDGTSTGESTFTISASGTSVAELTLKRTGDMTILGTLTQNSDRNAKTDFEELDGATILDKLAALPVTEWRYKDNDESVRHIGPMAQDFYAAFGLNGTETGITALDTSGVAIAAVKALNAELETKNAELEARLASLEALVEAIAKAKP